MAAVQSRHSRGKQGMNHGLRPLPAFVTVALTALSVAAEEPQVELAKPTPQQVAWQDMELQMFVCLDPCTWQDRDYDNHSTPLERINPTNLDTDQWCRVAKSWGAGQILFVAKHTGGFCWWQTETSQYGVRNTPWRDGRGDVVAELAESCRKHGLKLAIYVYPGDDNWGAYMGGGGKTRDPAKQQAYNKVFRRQLTEVLSRYGAISEVWFDGSCIIPVDDILRQHAPNALILQSPQANLRWVGNEAGWAPYPAWNSVKSVDGKTGVSTAAHGDPDGDLWMPLEVDTVNVHPHCWFWKSKGRTLKTLDELMRHYYDSVGHGAVLLLNSTPDTTGRIPEEDVRQYAAFGAEIRRRFGESIAETTGAGATVELALGGPTVINHVVTMEDIRQGERVRRYVLEGWRNGGWQELVEGISIGHKKIDSFPPVEVEKLRIRVTQSAAEPLIRRLAVFHVEGMFPDRLGESVWNFDEGTGQDIRDASGELQGTVVGAKWTEGRRGNALDFDGKTGYATLGNSDFHDSDFTITAWINPRSTAADTGTIVSKERNSLPDYNLRLYLIAGARLGFWITDNRGTNVWPFETEADSVPLGQWSHVAVTRRGPLHTLYINGKPLGAKSAETTIMHCNSLDLRIGGRYPRAGEQGDYVFDGAIDEVRFYTRALDAAELADPEKLPPPSRPNAWRKVGGWDRTRLAGETTWEIDLSGHIPAAGQYEVEFQKTAGPDPFEIDSVTLLLEGQPTPGFATPLARANVFNVNRTAAPTGEERSTVLRVVVRAEPGADSAGEILIRPAP